MHVISASRRTDIPAFHAEWFMRRVRSGGVAVVSPFGGGVREVSLLPADVIAVVFWTKNAKPIQPYLVELGRLGYPFTFLYTINNYPPALEPRVPPATHSLQTIKDLCRRFAGPVIRWRYDTVVLTEVLDRAWHIRNFQYLCDLLAPYTAECIFSFCDYYRKTVRNMDRLVPDYRRPDDALCREMAEEMGEIARDRGITLASCAHDFLVSKRVKKARCIDPEVLLQLVETQQKRDAVQALRTAPTRKECGCAASRDIGAYDTCLHGCVYCYANTDPDRAARNFAQVSPDRHSLDPRFRAPVTET